MPQQQNFFQSEEWNKILRTGFDVETCELKLSLTESYQLHIFRKGPFRIGYLSFPITIKVNDLRAISDYLDSRGINIHLLRIAMHHYDESDEKFSLVATLPESIIDNLDVYDPYAIKKLKRDLKRANNFEVTISTDCTTDLAKKIHEMYRQTVHIRAGNVRYNEKYFIALVDLASRNDNVHIATAEFENRLAGFLILIIDGREAHYLHGGYDRQFNKMGISDLLIEHAISFAKEKGALTFRMGASPIDQPQLRKYKEKWGATSRSQYTLEYKKSVFFAFLFSFASRLLSLVSKMKLPR